MEHIVYHDPNTDRAVIVTPAYNDVNRDWSLTDRQLLDKVIAKSIPKGINYSVMDTEQLPKDRDNRNSWKYDHQKKAIITN
jgi:Zn-finger nucleic acid-binding protein